MNDGGVLACAVNPTACRERLWDLRPVLKKKTVIVVGGGLGGMEAARVLTERGHKVILYEKEKDLGGHLLEASAPEFKKDLRRLLAWYKNQMKKLEIEIHTETEVSEELVNKKQPDEVILATGSTPIIPNIPGIDKPKVMTAIDLYLGRQKPGDEVVVVGGGLIGCETALWLAQKGKKVTIVEKLPKLMPTAIEHNANKELLVDMLVFNGVKIMTNTALAEVTNDGVRIVKSNLDVQPLSCSTVVLAVGLTPKSALEEVLTQKKYRVHKVGDCQEPRLILNAIWDGYRIGNAI